MSDDIGIVWEPKRSPEDFAKALRKREAWLAQPIRNFLLKSSAKIIAFAMEKAPKDTGRLARSIAHQLDTAQIPLFSKIGTNVGHAPPMEYGTRSWSEKPSMTGNTPLPTGPELDVWASRHGFPDGQTVANIIAARDGVKPRAYLRNAFEEGKRYVMRYAREMAKEIESTWRSMNP